MGTNNAPITDFMIWILRHWDAVGQEGSEGSFWICVVVGGCYIFIICMLFRFFSRRANLGAEKEGTKDGRKSIISKGGE